MSRSFYETNYLLVNIGSNNGFDQFFKVTCEQPVLSHGFLKYEKQKRR